MLNFKFLKIYLQLNENKVHILPDVLLIPGKCSLLFLYCTAPDIISANGLLIIFLLVKYPAMPVNTAITIIHVIICGTGIIISYSTLLLYK